jgi:hypothetical protein
MRAAARVVPIIVLAVSLTAHAQLPTATGRTINLSTDAQNRHKLFIPDGYLHTGQPVDVLFHFHGDPQTVENNAKYAGLNAVIINVTYSGLSSVYQTPFSDPALFGNIMNAALTSLRAQPDFDDNTTWGNLCVSSHSAGYAAVREILKPTQSYYSQIKGLMLADSLYASFTSAGDHTPLASQMVDFKRFALDASNGAKTLIFSHSQVETFTYCTTEECADNLITHVGATSAPFSGTGLGNVQFYRKAIKGNFQIWGELGSDAPAHSQHLQYMGQFLDELPLAHVPEPSAALLLAALALARGSRARARALPPGH